jgi:hypothetical protein
MRVRWRGAAMALPVLAALAACGRDAVQPLEPAAAPALDAMPGSMPDNGGYYGSGHSDPPPVPPPADVEDPGA